MKAIKLEIKQKEIFSNILSAFIITNVFIQLISTSRQLFMKRSIISARSIQLCRRYYPLCQEKGYLPSPDREASKRSAVRSEEHTSELQSRGQLVCRLLLEKKKRTK